MSPIFARVKKALALLGSRSQSARGNFDIFSAKRNCKREGPLQQVVLSNMQKPMFIGTDNLQLTMAQPCKKGLPGLQEPNKPSYINKRLNDLFKVRIEAKILCLYLLSFNLLPRFFILQLFLLFLQKFLAAKTCKANQPGPEQQHGGWFRDRARTGNRVEGEIKRTIVSPCCVIVCKIETL